MNDVEILALLFMFILFFIFIYFTKSFLNDIEQKQVIKNYPVYSHKILNDSINNSKDDSKNNINITNDGYINELMPKPDYLVSDDIDLKYKETIAKDNIPIDINLAKVGFCPKSREYKSDLPLPNVPMNYILDKNKSIKLSDEIKKIN